MTVLPIVARELRVASRKRNTYLGRVFAAFVPITMAAIWVPIFASRFNVSQGKVLFTALSVLLFGYCLLAGAQLTSDCLSSEKREGTIGLLFLTDLRGHDVVLGKLVSCSLNAVYGLLATVPVLGLAILLGGVTLDQLGRTALLFLNTLFFSLAAGVFVSALSRHDRRAMFATLCVILLTVFGPYGISLLYSWWQWKQFGRPPGGWDDLTLVVQISPLFAFRLLWANLALPTLIEAFYHSLLATHILGWMLLASASFIAPRVCRERVPGRAGMRWLLFRNRWSYGSVKRRTAFRARLLDRNAFYWLAARDRIKAHYVWFFVGALAGIWCWAAWMTQSFILDWEFSVAFLFLCFLFLKVWLASEVCTRLVEDRASGAFELLLSSPLTVRDIARGQSLALRRQFGQPVLALLTIALILMWWALRSPHSGHTNGEIKLLFVSLMIMLLADLVTLKWLGMWSAIVIGHVNKAALGACARILLLPTLVFVVVQMGYTLTASVAGGRPGEGRLMWKTCMLWLSIGLATDIYFGLRARWQFLHHFRDVATQRFIGPVPKLEPFMEILRALGSRVFPDRIRRVRGGPLVPFWKRWWIVGPALCLVCALASLAFWKRSLDRRVDLRLAAIRAAGQPTSAAELRRGRLAVVPQENAGLLFQKAGVQLMSFTPNLRSFGIKKREWPGPIGPLDAETKQALSNIVVVNRPTLELLHAGAKLPRSHYPVEWQYLPLSQAHWGAFSQLSRATDLLENEALHAIDSGNLSGALEGIRTLVALGRAMAEEPFLSAQTYRIQYLNSAARILERTLSHHPLGDRDLAYLQKDFQHAEAFTKLALHRAFIGERALGIEEFRAWDQAVPAAWGPTPGPWQTAVSELSAFTAKVLEIPNRTILRYLDIADEYIQRARGVGSRGSDASPAIVPSIQAAAVSGTEEARLASIRSYWDQVLTAQLELVARMRVVQAALAVERFRAANEGRIPTSLIDVIPGPLEASLPDPFTGTPLRFRPLQPGYLVYSIGPDRQDNEGLDPRSTPRREARGESDIAFRVAR